MSINHSTAETQLPNPSHLINALLRTTAALESLGKGSNRPRAIGRAAVDVLSKRKLPEQSLENYGLKIVAALPDFIDARHKLSAIESRRLKGQRVVRSEKEAQLKRVLPYNHILREMADHNPRLTMTDITTFVEGFLLASSSQETAFEAANATRDIIEGMRHELAFEATLYHIDGVGNIRPADIDTDILGTDIEVIYKGKHFGFDVKSNPSAARRCANDNLSYADKISTIPIWSGFKGRDFGDSLRILDQKAAIERASFVGDVLEAAYQHGCESAINMILYDGNVSKIYS